MKFDDILRELGDFGPYQRRIYAIVCAFFVPLSWVTLLQTFAMGSTDHWCKIAKWNETSCLELGYDTASCDVTIKKLVNIPLAETLNGSDVDEQVYQKCVRYNYDNVTDFQLISVIMDTNDTMASYSPLMRESRDIKSCDSGWEYDKSLFTRTVIQENNLVCSHENYIQYPQSFYYAGYLIGSALCGTLADRYGRRPVLCLTVTLNIVAGFAQVAFHGYWAFAVIRFFQGMANIVTYMMAYVIGTEFVGTSKRNLSGFLISIPYALGFMVLAGVAYLIRDWRMLEIAVTTPQVILLALLLVLPESARWLISNGEEEKAKKIILKAAKINKVKLSEHLLTKSLLIEQNKPAEKNKVTPLDIFRRPHMRNRTILMMYVWTVCAMTYHGLNLSTSTLGINVYLSFMVSGAIEIPAYILCIFVIETPLLGRRLSTVIALVISGAACLLSGFIPPGPLRAAVGMLGKFGITAAFAIVYLHTIELYPTPLRAIGLGINSTVGRVANILAPIILLTREYWEPAPTVIFGLATALAGVFVFFLPETRGRKLAETIEDGEMFGRIELVDDQNGVPEKKGDMA